MIRAWDTLVAVVDLPVEDPGVDKLVLPATVGRLKVAAVHSVGPAAAHLYAQQGVELEVGARVWYRDGCGPDTYIDKVRYIECRCIVAIDQDD